MSRLRQELSREREALRELQDSREDVELLCGELEKERGMRAELTRQVRNKMRDKDGTDVNGEKIK